MGPSIRKHALIWLLPPVLTGTVLRFIGYGAQILGGDELHCVRVVSTHSIKEIFATHLETDFCIPLAAFYRFLLGQGLVLSELELRLPITVTGIALLVVVPWLMAPRIGRSASVVLAWLLALSPMLVLYSRIARPYLPMVLLGFAAVIAFERWHRHGSRLSGLLYLALATAAILVHLGAATFVLSPFLFAAGSMIAARRIRPREVRSLGILLGLLFLAMLCFLVPGWESFRNSVLTKAGQGGGPTLLVIVSTAMLGAGTPIPALAVMLLLAAARGLVVLLRERPRFGAYSVTLVVGHLVGLLILSPHGIDLDIVFARYMLIVLPILLAWVSVGLTHPLLAGSPRATLAQAVAVIGIILIHFCVGPLARSQFLEGSFAHHYLALRFDRRLPEVPAEAVPRFYRSLGREREAGAVLEYPVHPSWSKSLAPALYQVAHGQPVLTSVPESVGYDPGFGFRNLIRPVPSEIQASRARYLVVHRDIGREEIALRARLRLARAKRSRPSRRMVPEARLRRVESYRNAAERMVARLRDSWGYPHYSDHDIDAWDLRVVRDSVMSPSVSISPGKDPLPAPMAGDPH